MLLIENMRNGYSPSQCGYTFTVWELIDFLSEFDSDTPVYISNDGGYTYSSITEENIRES